MTQKRLQRIVLPLLLLFLAATLLTGCAGIRRLFSKAGSTYNEAVKAWDQGDYTKALLTMAEAAQMDPKLPDPKIFFKDNFDTGIANIKQGLEKKGSQSDADFAEQKYDTYVNLQKVYDAVAQLPLPFKFKVKKENFVWTTEIKDFSKEIAEARAEAYKLVYQEGKKLLAKGDVNKAGTVFRRAYSKYQVSGTPEKTEAAKNISKEFSDFGATVHGSKDIQTVENGIKAYKTALSFNKDNKEAQDGLAFLIKRIAGLYVDRGKQLEAQGGPDALKKALDAYETALSWDKNNQDAQTLADGVKQKLAEYYYQQGRNLERSKQNVSRDDIINAYKEAQKWVPDYKDTNKRIFIAYMSTELTDLQNNIRTSREELKKLSSRLQSISKATDTGISATGALIDISDKLTDIDNMMKTTANVLQVFTPIPIVGQVILPVQRTAATLHKTVNPVEMKVAQVTKAAVVPTNDKLETFKGIVDSAIDKMKSVDKTLIYSDQFAGKIQDCVVAKGDKTLYQTVQTSAGQINSYYEKLNAALKDVNGSLVTVDKTTSEIAGVAKYVNPVKKGIDAVRPLLDKASGLANDLNSVLDKKITVNILVKKWTFSVNDILNGISGVMDKAVDLLMSAAKKILNPVLKQFNMKIPDQIPGLDELDKQMDNFQGYYDSINSQIDVIKNKVSSYADYQQKIYDEMNKIWAQAGCH